MGEAWDGLTGALRSLVAGSHLAGPDDLPGLAAEAGGELGARETVLYLVDYDQVLLLPLVGRGQEPLGPLSVEGTLPGRAFSLLEPALRRQAGELVMWVPVLDGTERLGVLKLTFAEADTLSPEPLVEDAGLLAALLAELVLTRSRYGDVIERTRRRLPMSLPAELQWTLLPPLTFATPQVAISGVLLPTHEVAGDSFDYALNGDIAHLAVLDAMGHGLEALLLSAVAVGALRNARRAGLDLLDTVRSTDKHLAARFGPEGFVTGIVAELDTRTGVYRWVTCGHPPVLLLRGGRIVKRLEAVTDPPLGMLTDPPRVGVERLQRGDRLLLYTDGVTEARSARGDFFGTGRLADFVTRQAAAGLPAAETLRRLNLAILDHQNGMLQDDATTLLVEWAGDEPARMVL